jgi:putative FmdB family regulatory protein
MPIYEYACPHCRTIFQFWTQRINEDRQPTCPKCKKQDLEKVMSSFAIGKAQPKTNQSADSEEGGMPDPFANMSEAQMASAQNEMMKIMQDADSIDENDPRQMGALMRKLKESTGMDMGPEMDEAIRRLESGEDPEKIEEEFGELFDGMNDMGGMGGSGGGWSRDDNLYDF